MLACYETFNQRIFHLSGSQSSTAINMIGLHCRNNNKKFFALRNLEYPKKSLLNFRFQVPASKGSDSVVWSRAQESHIEVNTLPVWIHMFAGWKSQESMV